MPDYGLQLGLRQTAELREEIFPAFENLSAEIRFVIAEVEERRGCAELLALKQHRRAGGEQQQGGHGAVQRGSAERVRTLAISGIRDLIVILQKRYKIPGFQIERGRAARLFLPLITLALVKVAVFSRRDELLRLPEVIGVIGFIAARDRHLGAVVEIVVP